MTDSNSTLTSPQTPKDTNTNTTNNEPDTRKRVIIVGGGSAAMSAAHSLSLSPEKFIVDIYDRAPTLGGSATSVPLPDPERFGADYINDGVQGCSPVFYNTLRMFQDTLGLKASEVGMQVSFGKGKDAFWSNVFPSELVDKFSADIKKFGRVLKTIKRFEILFAAIPVDKMLKLFRFTPEFGERMIFPLVALFFGTGNETKHISSAILERVFLDPSMRLFEFSEDSLLASVPTMMAFPKLGEVYELWKEEVTKNGNVRIHLSREVMAVERGSKAARAKGGHVLITSRHISEEEAKLDPEEEVDHPERIAAKGSDSRQDIFDELIIGCDADTALKILGKDATWRERAILGSVVYKWDITYTHFDAEYMKKHYEMHYNEEFNAKRDDEESKKQFKFAKENWKPLYLIKEYDVDPASIEMSFVLTTYQPQFKDDKPLEDQVFQTIYLDRGQSDRWTANEVAEDKIILKKWWKQQSHRASLYYKVVPWLWTINNRNHTNFCGAWNVLNMHEIGICSGFGAAYSLGGKYPFADDENCGRLFKLCYALLHMGRVRKEDRKGFFA
ncbi:hypothetical protein CF327_g5836 [Tilletia walkeri]|uniref:Amine oxidase domain-containing protein n=1 Tax=Tilletia walkeri TaxID=117179 RepID=A0A8X7N5W8_9BASI|nr:hypothetical protein CF327_g5836 [Tilletia walkeri]KAE8267766.1 hypothetical protein A4X09_0g4576 [Tilletia walkeri]